MEPLSQEPARPTPIANASAAGEGVAAELGIPAAAPRRRGYAGIAWCVILLMVAIAIVPQFVDIGQAGDPYEDPLGLIMMRIQGQYMVGAAGLIGDADAIYRQAEPSLNAGTLGQQQRFVVLAAELAGPAEAGRVLSDINLQIQLEAARADGEPFVPSTIQQDVLGILERLYPANGVFADAQRSLARRVERLTAEERDLLITELGWFGRLALAPEGGADRGREAVLSDARRVTLVIIAGVSLLALAALVGAVGLVILAVGVWKGRIAGGLAESEVHHGFYAETFALWMTLFLAFQLAAGIIAAFLPALALASALVAFAASLIALGWPLLRGLSWDRVRRDVGLTAGRKPLLEIAAGAGGYLMALPMLAVGVVGTLILMLIQAALASPGAPFTAAGGPAHPIVLQLAESAWWVKLNVFVLAAIAAPIVEETMFRGVLYRHLRDATRRYGPYLSVVLAATLNAFLFAAIHPQGWVAIPALMSLAYSFLLLREWRGSVLPAMIAHGISNAIVMTLLLSIISS